MHICLKQLQSPGHWERNRRKISSPPRSSWSRLEVAQVRRARDCASLSPTPSAANDRHTGNGEVSHKMRNNQGQASTAARAIPSIPLSLSQLRSTFRKVGNAAVDSFRAQATKASALSGERQSGTPKSKISKEAIADLFSDIFYPSNKEIQKQCPNTGTEELYLGVERTLCQQGDRSTIYGGWKNRAPIRG